MQMQNANTNTAFTRKKTVICGFYPPYGEVNGTIRAVSHELTGVSGLLLPLLEPLAFSVCKPRLDGEVIRLLLNTAPASQKVDERQEDGKGQKVQKQLLRSHCLPGRYSCET